MDGRELSHSIPSILNTRNGLDGRELPSIHSFLNTVGVTGGSQGTMNTHRDRLPHGLSTKSVQRISILTADSSAGLWAQRHIGIPHPGGSPRSN